MSSTPFGDHLKREREMRGVTIGEIAAATRISERFLEALENEHWDRLPGGAFNRGFVRSVARFLGLDEESMVAEYVLETKGGQAATASEPAAQGMPRDWRPVIAFVAGLVVLAIVATIGFHYYRARARARSQQQMEQQAAPAPRTPVAPPANSPSDAPAPSSSGGAN